MRAVRAGIPLQKEHSVSCCTPWGVCLLCETELGAMSDCANWPTVVLNILPSPTMCWNVLSQGHNNTECDLKHTHTHARAEVSAQYFSSSPYNNDTKLHQDQI